MKTVSKNTVPKSYVNEFLVREILGYFKSFVRFYESTLNCNIAVNPYII